MIVTEEEAKTKRCQESFPAAQGLSSHGGVEAVPMPPNALSYAPGGTYAIYTAPLNCIGSACMAWRWQLFGHHRDVDRTQEDDRTLGYCGKAGKP